MCVMARCCTGDMGRKDLYLALCTQVRLKHHDAHAVC